MMRHCDRRNVVGVVIENPDGAEPVKWLLVISIPFTTVSEPDREIAMSFTEPEEVVKRFVVMFTWPACVPKRSGVVV